MRVPAAVSFCSAAAAAAVISAAAGQHSFTASMEMQEGQNFIISFFQVGTSHPAPTVNCHRNAEYVSYFAVTVSSHT
jgi:hypothetical protein